MVSTAAGGAPRCAPVAERGGAAHRALPVLQARIHALLGEAGAAVPRHPGGVAVGLRSPGTAHGNHVGPRIHTGRQHTQHTLHARPPEACSPAGRSSCRRCWGPRPRCPGRCAGRSCQAAPGSRCRSPANTQSASEAAWPACKAAPVSAQAGQQRPPASASQPLTGPGSSCPCWTPGSSRRGRPAACTRRPPRGPALGGPGPQRLPGGRAGRATRPRPLVRSTHRTHQEDGGEGLAGGAVPLPPLQRLAHGVGALQAPGRHVRAGGGELGAALLRLHDGDDGVAAVPHRIADGVACMGHVPSLVRSAGGWVTWARSPQHAGQARTVVAAALPVPFAGRGGQLLQEGHHVLHARRAAAAVDMLLRRRWGGGTHSSCAAPHLHARHAGGALRAGQVLRGCARLQLGAHLRAQGGCSPVSAPLTHACRTGCLPAVDWCGPRPSAKTRRARRTRAGRLAAGCSLGRWESRRSSCSGGRGGGGGSAVPHGRLPATAHAWRALGGGGGCPPEPSPAAVVSGAAGALVVVRPAGRARRRAGDAVPMWLPVAAAGTGDRAGGDVRQGETAAAASAVHLRVHLQLGGLVSCRRRRRWRGARLERLCGRQLRAGLGCCRWRSCCQEAATARGRQQGCIAAQRAGCARVRSSKPTRALAAAPVGRTCCEAQAPSASAAPGSTLPAHWWRCRQWRPSPGPSAPHRQRPRRPCPGTCCARAPTHGREGRVGRASKCGACLARCDSAEVRAHLPGRSASSTTGKSSARWPRAAHTTSAMSSGSTTSGLHAQRGSSRRWVLSRRRAAAPAARLPARGAVARTAAAPERQVQEAVDERGAGAEELAHLQVCAAQRAQQLLQREAGGVEQRGQPLPQQQLAAQAGRQALGQARDAGQHRREALAAAAADGGALAGAVGAVVQGLYHASQVAAHHVWRAGAQQRVCHWGGDQIEGAVAEMIGRVPPVHCVGGREHKLNHNGKMPAAPRRAARQQDSLDPLNMSCTSPGAGPGAPGWRG